MKSATRIALICTTTIAPGLFFAGISTYYLFQDWAALDRSFQSFSQLSVKLSQSAQPTVPQLLIAKAAEDRHRINCFAEGIGVLAGWGIAAIGIHSLCAIQNPKSKS